MDIRSLLSLVSQVSSGKDVIAQGAIGYYGFSFIFKSFNTEIKWINGYGSSKFSHFGVNREVLKRFWKSVDRYRSKDNLLHDLLFKYNDKDDLLIAGALKTLVPSLEFGVDDGLYDAWVFVKTPDGRQFPATIYYGRSGTSLGGWQSYINISGKNLFPKKFSTIINYSPFDFVENDLEAFIEALELALAKVPVSDFYGVYSHDFGNTLMGIKLGRPFKSELGSSWNDEDIKHVIELLD